MCCIIYICIFLTLLLFPVAHYFIIISCVHDYSSFTSVFTLTTQCPFVPLYPCSVVVVFCCYARVYITLCTSCNNLQLQSQFDLITPIVIHVITGWNGRASCELQWHMACETPLFQLHCAMRERDWKSLNNFTHVKCVRSECASTVRVIKK